MSSSPKIVFQPGSFWYRCIPEKITLHPQSKQLVDEFLRQKAATKNCVVGINTTAYTSPVYVADKTTPRIPVGVVRCQPFTDEQYRQLAVQFSAVPIPPFANPA